MLGEFIKLMTEWKTQEKRVSAKIIQLELYGHPL